MGCCISKSSPEMFPKSGLKLYSKEGKHLYTLFHMNDTNFLLMNTTSQEIVTLSKMHMLSVNMDHLVIEGWVNPGWWITASWFFMFDEEHKILVNNNFLVNAHYLRLEVSKLCLTKKHSKLGIKYMISIGTYDMDSEFTVFSEIMYGL